jgi:hypothetical protein
MELNKEQIERDIKAYRDRLGRAEAKLNDLPKKGSTWKESSKIRLTRRALLSEIRHIKTLMSYANEALVGVAD